ncbi:MAG: hypothetical protein LBC41_00195, partial [Clostridiales bacterium]|nr:hypothetical protein [Clostridiales bacterium]
GCSGGGYKKPIDTLIKALKTGKGGDFCDASMPGFMIDSLVELTSKSKKQIVEGAKFSFDENFKNRNKQITEIYGKNWSISYKITDTYRLDKEDLKDLAETLVEYYSLNSKPPKLQDGYELEFDLTVKGKDDKVTKEIEATVLKYKGKWYIDQRIFSVLDFY